VRSGAVDQAVALAREIARAGIGVGRWPQEKVNCVLPALLLQTPSDDDWNDRRRERGVLNK
jgi:hypothetical protein